MNLLLSNQIDTRILPEIQSQLQLFYNLVPSLYGENACTANVHSLIHVVKFVKLWGPLWTISTFPFENANGILKRQIHGTRNILQQMIFMMKLREQFSLHNQITEHTLGVVVGKVLTQEIPLREAEVLCITSPAMIFKKAKVNNALYHSNKWEKPQSSRKSSVVSFILNTAVHFGEIQYFSLTNQQPLALVKVFSILNEGTLSEVDLPHDKNINPNLLDNTIFKVTLETELIAIPLSSFQNKCILINADDYNYIIPLTNSIECH